MKSSRLLFHTKQTRLGHALDFLISLAPVLIWSVFIFGARVLTLCAVSVIFCFLFDFLFYRFVLRYPTKSCFDPFNAVFGLLTAFMMPVTVPVWLPAVGALFCTFAKNFRVIRNKRFFNPYVFSAFMLNVFFHGYMNRFTRPFAYFSAFTFSLDDALVKGYRVLSPLQYMADGRVYEDGVMAQFYGYAAGCMGEIAAAAVLIGFIWLLIRKRVSFGNTLSFVAVIAVLAAIFPSRDAETNFYVYSFLLSGGTLFLSVFAMNEGGSVPDTKIGGYVFGLLSGILYFILRSIFPGAESLYTAILLMNAAAPFLSSFTEERPVGEPKKKLLKAKGRK